MPDTQPEEEKIARLIKSACGEVSASPSFKDRLLSRLMQQGRETTVRGARKFRVRPAILIPLAAIAVALLILFVIVGWPGQSPGIVSPPPTSTTTIPTSSTTSPVSTTPTTSPLPTTSPTTTLVAGKWTLKILVTDAPPQQNVTVINVTLSNIQVSKYDAAGDATAWVPVFEGEHSFDFDLIKLRDSNFPQLLGISTLDYDTYSQIRMDVVLKNAEIDGNVITTGIKFPSNTLKIVASFEIKEPPQVTVLTIDFDADQSLVFTGNGEIIFNPTVKTTVTYE